MNPHYYSHLAIESANRAKWAIDLLREDSESPTDKKLPLPEVNSLAGIPMIEERLVKELIRNAEKIGDEVELLLCNVALREIRRHGKDGVAISESMERMSRNLTGSEAVNLSDEESAKESELEGRAFASDDGIVVFEAVSAVLIAFPGLTLKRIPPLFDLNVPDEQVSDVIGGDKDALEAVMEARAALRDGSGDLHPACYAKCRIIVRMFEKIQKTAPKSDAIAMGLKAARRDAHLD